MAQNPSIQKLAQLMQERQNQERAPYVLLLGSSLSLTPTVRRAFAGAEDWEAFWIEMERTTPTERKVLLRNPLDALGLEPGYQAMVRLAEAGYFNVILTLNVDDAIDDAVRPLPAKQSILLTYDGGNAEQIVSVLSRPSPRIKVIKLRGDINISALPLTPTGQFEFPYNLERSVVALLEQDMILVGDMPYDTDLQRCIRKANSELWCILPGELAINSFIWRVKQGRPFGEIITGADAEFNAFFTALEEALAVAQSIEDERGRAQALAKMERREAIPALLKRLRDGEMAVRLAAVEVLGRIDVPQAVSALLGTLRDEDATVRRAAAEALGKLEAQEAISALLAALEDEDKGVRRAAVEALGKLKAQEAIPALLAALEDEDRNVRVAAAETLGKLEAQEATSALLAALEDEDRSVRRAAVEALGKLEAQEAIPALLAALKDGDWGVYRAAVEALGNLGAREAIPALLAALEDEGGDIRRAAAEALGKLEAQEAIPTLLVRLVEDEDRDVRRATAEALEKLGQTGLLAEMPKTEDVRKPIESAPAAPPDLGRYGEADGPRQRFEEVMAGISFGSADTLSRTITALVTDQQGNPRLLLPGGMLSEDAEVIQPSRQHKGNDQDRIGTVEKVSEETGIAALARLEGDRTFLSLLPNRQPVKGVKEPESGLRVCKFGAASGYTEATITQTGQFYRISREITLSDGFFIEATGFSELEDVGALVVEVGTNKAMGVIVNSNDSGTICSPIQPVLDSLGVKLIQDPVHYVRQQQATDEITAHGDLTTGEDKLGFNHYVDAFARLIEDTEPPLTIGIYGAWGTGKTFLMNKIVERLNPKSDVKQVRKLSIWQKLFRLSKTQMPVVWFEAWDYNACDKLWAGLVERIFLSIENSGLGWYGQLRINLKRNLERQWRELRRKLLPYTLIAIVIGALTIGFVLNNQDAWAKAVGGSTAFVLLVSLVRQLAGVFSISASQRIVDLFATTDYQEEIGFMGRIKQDLESFANSLPEGMKVVVFIDDLDRCDPQKAVEVLEAIKLLLDFDRFIVFLALDARVITQAIEEHYGKVLAEAEITGYEYLNKIVQIPFSIPEPPPSELCKYLGSLVDMSEDEILSMTSVTPSEEKVADEFVATPLEPKVQGIEVAERPPDKGPSPSIPESPTTEPEEKISAGPEDRLPEPAPLPRPTEKPFDILRVPFTPAEQKAFIGFCSHLDPNPRRVKRLVNVYRLVRALIGSWRQAQEQGSGLAFLGVPEDPHQVLAWLILCEQWPYAAHVMLELLDCTLKQEVGLAKRRELLGISVEELWQAAKKQIDKEKDETLKKLDLTYDRLQSFMEKYLAKLTLGDVQQLRPFTVNFNPALSAEVRLTLSSGERGPVQPVEVGTPVSAR